MQPNYAFQLPFNILAIQIRSLGIPSSLEINSIPGKSGKHLQNVNRITVTVGYNDIAPMLIDIHNKT